ncbi:two-component system response regulator [Aquabacterium sp.]|uniref:HD-GYP domain-containing protein n=1 Tax=Aquabacterium sp. TaxID=1872578 RepID=UPI0019938625|nr:two-component system response regulator [Aquabacterium sp.]MBC7700562.1 two-component system response regulator [Aquabacterium sp.]
MLISQELRRPTILVADDSPQNIELLSRVLGQEYRIKVATSGEKALKIAYSDEPPDLILLDIMMPDLSGLQVCQRIKANPDRRRIPIIFVTAMTTVEDESLGLAMGAVDYISKPISPPLVQARVRTHLALYDQSRELARMVAQRTAELVATRQQIIRRLGRAAEYKDNETGNHVVRMSHIARLVAQQAGLGPEAVQLVFQTAAMHDLGKIGIPDHILLKPGPLTDGEWVLMRQHAQIGADIIGRHDNELLATARAIALTHHEKWDGTGYPQGLKGEQIPLYGRIVAIADVFDALMTRRPYKAALPAAESLAIMAEQKGTHFDPMLLACFFQQKFEILKVMELYSDDRGAMMDQ